MSLQSIAQRIPSEYRQEILETGMIQKAQATPDNPSMFYLFTIWKNYVETDNMDIECRACLERILKNYKELSDVFVQLERAALILKQV
jgi:hypothetical protein